MTQSIVVLNAEQHAEGARTLRELKGQVEELLAQNQSLFRSLSVLVNRTQEKQIVITYVEYAKLVPEQVLSAWDDPLNRTFTFKVD